MVCVADVWQAVWALGEARRGAARLSHGRGEVAARLSHLQHRRHGVGGERGGGEGVATAGALARGRGRPRRNIMVAGPQGGVRGPRPRRHRGESNRWSVTWSRFLSEEGGREIPVAPRLGMCPQPGGFKKIFKTIGKQQIQNL